MYSDFALVYDRLMDDIDYPAWAEFYRQMLAASGARVREAAECGCGTGSMTVELAKKGMILTASDLSEEMLMKAADKARRRGVRARFVCQDMRMLRMTKPADGVLCCCDGVNYMLTDEDAAAFFASAYKALKPGGVLAFDVSSEEKLRGMIRDGFFGEDRDDVTYLWTNEAAGEDRIHMELAFFVKEADGRYRRFDEEQTQRIYTPEILSALLEQAGFTDIRVYGDRRLTPPQAGDMRIHITARKA